MKYVYKSIYTVIINCEDNDLIYLLAGYEKQLGKKHQLTKEAIDQRNNLARWGSVLTDL